jgi:hypothetical protein
VGKRWLMMVLSAALAAGLAVCLLAAPAMAAEDGEPTLLGRAILASDAYQPGPPSGAFIAPDNGVTPPFPGQPIPGFSPVLDAGHGELWAMPDNGYGAKSSPTTLPGGGVRRGRRAVLEQAALVFQRFPSVVVERMSTSVVGDWATVRARYRTIEGRQIDFVDRIHVRDGRIVALRANMRADQARGAAREQPRP